MSKCGQPFNSHKLNQLVNKKTRREKNVLLSKNCIFGELMNLDFTVVAPYLRFLFSHIFNFCEQQANE